MSIGPMGTPGSVAGSQLPQSKGADVDRTQQEGTDQARRAAAARQAESAEGVGHTEEDHESSERDADGHRPWEAPQDRGEAAADENAADDAALSRDASGDRGANLDLTG
jgi:hypothetical protein